MLAAFFLMAMRVAALDAPVLGGDEYAYFHAAKYQATGDQLFTLDPGLAQVDNKVYPWLYRLWAAVSVDHADMVGRLFNSVLYCLAALLLFAVFRRCLDRRSATLGALLYLLMPFSFYATTLMPEVEFQLSIYLLVLVWVMGRGPAGWAQLVLAAAVSALSYLIKPHGVAAILASAAYLAWSRLGLADGSALRRVALGVLQALAYLACTAVLIKLLRWMLDPGGTSPLVASFYQIYLDKLRTPGYMQQSLLSMAGYIGGHLWVWLIFFAPGVVAILADLRSWLPGRVATAQGAAADEPRRKLALLLFLLMGSLLCMVALFTAAASGVRDFERWRLHGRYLAALLPFLLAYGVWWAGQRPPRWVAGLAVLALVTFVYAGRFWFRLFPWDYPDLFGLFDPKMQHWTFDHVERWPLRATLIVGLLCWAAFAFSRRQRLAYVVFVAVAMLAAQGQMAAWLKVQNQWTRQARVDGAAIRAFMAQAAPASGLVATYDRNGATSYMLAAMDMQVHVLELAQRAALSARDVPAGVSWIVAPASMEVPLPDAWKLDIGEQHLYLLENSNMRPIAPEKPQWDGKPLLIDMTSTGGSARFQGFRFGENWGRWSTAQRARVVLPRMVSGRVRIEFFGWVFDAARNPGIVVRLGDVAATVPMTAGGQGHQLVLEVKTPTDSLWFESTPAGDAGSQLGVAVGNLQITAAPAQP